MKAQFDLYSRTNQLIVDGCIFALALSAAYLIRFEGLPTDWPATKQLLLWVPWLIIARLLVNWEMGIYRFIWRYISLNDSIAIARSLCPVTVGLLALRYLYPRSFIFGPRLHIPLGTIALEYLLSLTGMLAVRMSRRILYERYESDSPRTVQRVKRTLLYGAGNAGVLLAKNVKGRPDIIVVGFLDDDPRKMGTVIVGVKVLGNRNSMKSVFRDQRIDEVVISISSPSKQFLGDVLAKCRAERVAVKIIPNVQDLFLRCTNIDQIREVCIADLLGRDGIEAIEAEPIIRQAYSGKRILVTGAGGSIGSELARQLLLLEPGSLAVLDKDENSIYDLEQELVSRFPELHVMPYIADIRNHNRLGGVFEEFRPEIVFHAAAHKHVPLMEKNPCEAVLNNVCGAQNVLEASRMHGVVRFIYISTDKAVNPTNVMGATKRLGEMLVKFYAKHHELSAVSVRFGNVIGSRGSVVPLFQKQIAAGGPVTITHPEMVRFFMTIPEAVRLVLCAGSSGSQGETFVLDMGAPRKIIDVAHQMIALAGFRPGKDIEIQVSGLRPGEKLSEELVSSSESLCQTDVAKLLKITPSSDDALISLDGLRELVRASEANDSVGVYRCLLNLSIGFRREENSDITKLSKQSAPIPFEVAGAPPVGLLSTADKSIQGRASGWLETAEDSA